MTVSKVYARLVVDDAAAAIDFYTSAMGATETERHTDGDGRIVHAELLFGTAPNSSPAWTIRPSPPACRSVSVAPIADV